MEDESLAYLRSPDCSRDTQGNFEGGNQGEAAEVDGPTPSSFLWGWGWRTATTTGVLGAYSSPAAPHKWEKGGLTHMMMASLCSAHSRVYEAAQVPPSSGNTMPTSMTGLDLQILDPPE